MTEKKQILKFEDKPSVEINTKEIFGIECNFKVQGFANNNFHVPEIDKTYKFNPETTLAILAGFAGNRRVLIHLVECFEDGSVHSM